MKTTVAFPTSFLGDAGKVFIVVALLGEPRGLFWVEGRSPKSLRIRAKASAGTEGLSAPTEKLFFLEPPRPPKEAEVLKSGRASPVLSLLLKRGSRKFAEGGPLEDKDGAIGGIPPLLPLPPCALLLNPGDLITLSDALGLLFNARFSKAGDREGGWGPPLP